MSVESARRPPSITLLAIVLLLFGIFAFVGSLFLWGQGFILQAPEGVDVAFPITDSLVNAPASILAAIGLWTLKRFGYLASYFVAGFYIYASVYIFVEVITGGPPYPVEIVIPQVLAVLAAVALLIYPDRHRARFR
jgi:ABC-type Na+ efflux pump permease subunit